MTYSLTFPEELKATIDLPSSKSISNRALIIHALAGGGGRLQNLSVCDDTEVMVDALQRMPEVIDIKAAGTAMRFMTAYLAATPSGTHVITGTERMQQRPIGILVEALRQLGADIDYLGKEGYPPLRIHGKKLQGGSIEIPGNVSSQFISALLMMGPVMREGLTLKMTDQLISKPYIELTLWMMREFGADVEWAGADTVKVTNRPYQSRDYFIESDWSAASYWFEMVALTKNREAEIKLTGLSDGSMQGDSMVRFIFSLLGVKTLFASREQGIPTTVTLRPTGLRVPRIDYDFINAPDLAQTVVCTCVGLGIPFHFKGLHSLKIKETDRIEALKTELRKLGYVIRDVNDSELIWDGERCEPTSGRISTYDDHRMAMAFAPLSLCMPHISIDHPEVVSKSYPMFWDHLKAIGVDVHE